MKSKIFFLNNLGFQHNILIGTICLLVLFFIESTKLGQRLLNEAYDDYISVSTSKFFNNGIAEDSLKIKLVGFDDQDYLTNNNIFWTSRIKLGEILKKSVENSARMVILDVSIENPVPIVCDSNICVDENEFFLHSLEDSLKKATETGTIIIVPWFDLEEPNITPTKNEYLTKLSKIVTSYENVRLASTDVFTNSDDFKTRNFSFYSKINDLTILSVPVLVTLYQKFNAISLKSVDIKIREIEDFISKNNSFEYEVKDQRNEKIFTITSYNESIFSRYTFNYLPHELIKNSNSYLKNSDPPSYFLNATKFLSLDGHSIFEQILIVGSTWPEMGDIFHSPLGDIPGIYLHANAINTLFDKGSSTEKQKTFTGIAIRISIVFFISSLFSLLQNLKILYIICTFSIYHLAWITPIFLNLGLDWIFYSYHIRTISVVICFYNLINELIKINMKKKSEKLIFKGL